LEPGRFDNAKVVDGSAILSISLLRLKLTHYDDVRIFCVRFLAMIRIIFEGATQGSQRVSNEL